MNKVVNINLNGIIISIDEVAYGKLKNYIDALHRHFAGTEGSAEIISDIETRIAELLQLKLSASYTVIQEHDVDEVIAIMGNPGQMEDAGEAEDEKEAFGTSARNTEPKRLRRDPRNKVLGGVCSGVSNYMNIDPVFLRALFLIAFFIFGSGLLIYLLLWIAMPEATAGDLPQFNEARNKRLFRNEDEKMLGGVCAGAANYFGIDAVWLRLLFLIALFFYGSGVLLYIVLWAIIPKAVTAAQKLQMKGEPVDVNNIERVIRKTFGANKQQPVGFLNNLVSMCGQLLRFILKAAGKIVGIFTAFLATVLIVFWMIGVFYHNEKYDAFVQLFTLSDEIALYAKWGAACFILSVICGLLFLTYRLLFNMRLKLRYAGLINTVLCVASIILITIASIKYSMEIRSRQHVITRSYIHPVSDTLYLETKAVATDARGISITIDDERFELTDDEIRNQNFDLVFTNDANHVLFNSGRVYLKPSLTDSLEVKIRKQARGATSEGARDVAEAIQYEVNREGNRLVFDKGILLKPEAGYRYQDVQITLGVPVGTILVMKERMMNMVRGLDYDLWYGSVFKMTPDGLVCLDCDKDDDNDNDRKRHSRKRKSERVHIEVHEDGDDEDDENVRITIENHNEWDTIGRKTTTTRKKIGPVTIETQESESHKK